jgi:hypothetical protein
VARAAVVLLVLCPASRRAAGAATAASWWPRSPVARSPTRRPRPLAAGASFVTFRSRSYLLGFDAEGSSADGTAFGASRRGAEARFWMSSHTCFGPTRLA